MPDSQLPNSEVQEISDDDTANPIEEEPTREELPKYLQVLQVVEDAIRDGITLDPSGENRAVVVAVTTTNGKIFEIVADSTDSQVFKGQEIWGKAYVEAEVTKVRTAFASKGPIPPPPNNGGTNNLSVT